MGVQRRSLSHVAPGGWFEPPFAPFLPTSELPAPTAAIDASPFVCFHVNREWLPYLIGAWATLTRASIYSGTFEEKKFAVLEAENFLCTIHSGNVQCEDAMIDFRQNPANVCQLEYSTDGGVTWLLAFDYSRCRRASVTLNVDSYIDASTTINNDVAVYQGDILNLAPAWAYGDSDDIYRDAAMCAALHLFVDAALDIIAEGMDESAALSLDHMWEIARDAVGYGLAFYEATVWFAPNVAWFPALSLGIAECVRGAWDLVNREDGAAFRDRAAREVVYCRMLLHMQGATPTFNQWKTSLDGETFTGNAAKQADVLRLLLQDENAYMETMLVLADAIEVARIGGLDDCPCQLDEWEHVVNLREPLPDGLHVVHGEHVAGQGVVGRDFWVAGTFQRGVDLHYHLPLAATITAFSVVYDYERGEMDDANSIGLFQGSNSPAVLQFIRMGDLNDGVDIRQDYVATASNCIEAQAAVICSQVLPPERYGGSCLLKELRYRGVGVNPFA